ncbi:hypothetical protein AMK59_4153, partial [Oryctes borbonicus]
RCDAVERSERATRRRIFDAATPAAVILTPSVQQVHDACNWLPQWQSVREPKPYVMYSLRHGVNLSRRACRNDPMRPLLLILALVVGLAAGSPFLTTNTRPQPDPQPLPEDYNSNRPYEGVNFGPMGPSRYSEPAARKSAITLVTTSSSSSSSSSIPCTTSTSTSSSSAGRSPRANDDHSVPERYQVASVSFQRVKTPFIIGLWIFCASLAKIVVVTCDACRCEELVIHERICKTKTTSQAQNGILQIYIRKCSFA